MEAKSKGNVGPATSCTAVSPAAAAEPPAQPTTEEALTTGNKLMEQQTAQEKDPNIEYVLKLCIRII